MKRALPQRRHVFKLTACLFFLLLSIGSLLVTTHSVSAHEVRTNTMTMTTNWPMAGFDAQHTNFNPYETTIITKNVSRLVPAWHQSGAYIVAASSAVFNSITYIVTKNMIYAFNTITGHTAWSAQLPFPTFVGAAPVVAEGLVYVSSDEGSNGKASAIAYNAQTGKIAWANQNAGSGYPISVHRSA